MNNSPVPFLRTRRRFPRPLRPLLMVALPTLAFLLGVWIDRKTVWQWAMLASAVCYMSAHLLRVLRLIILLGPHAPGVRRVGLAHFSGSLCGVMAPFKIGELVRIGALLMIRIRPGQTLAAVWIERMCDALILLPALAIAGLLHVVPTLVWSGLLMFLLLSATALLLLPSALDQAACRLAARSAPGRLSFLWACAGIRNMLQGVPTIASRRIPHVALLTLLIWMMEGATVSVLINRLPLQIVLLPLDVSSGALTTALSPLPRTQTALAAVSPENPFLMGLASQYLAVMLVVLGLGSAIGILMNLRFLSRR